jgi:hypothetical protein
MGRRWGTRVFVLRRLAGMAAPSLPDPSFDPSSHARPAPPGGRWLPGERHVHDACGTTWRVREMDADTLPGARGARCLVFDSGRSMRRSWVVPDDWRTMPEATLAALVSGPCGPEGG